MTKTNTPKIVLLVHAQNFLLPQKNEQWLSKTSHLRDAKPKIITSNLSKCKTVEIFLHTKIGGRAQDSLYFQTDSPKPKENNESEFAKRIEGAAKEHGTVLAVYHQQMSDLLDMLGIWTEDVPNEQDVFLLDISSIGDRKIIFRYSEKVMVI